MGLLGNLPAVAPWCVIGRRPGPEILPLHARQPSIYTDRLVGCTVSRDWWRRRMNYRRYLCRDRNWFASAYALTSARFDKREKLDGTIRPHNWRQNTVQTSNALRWCIRRATSQTLCSMSMHFVNLFFVYVIAVLGNANTSIRLTSVISVYCHNICGASITGRRRMSYCSYLPITSITYNYNFYKCFPNNSRCIG